MDQADRERSAKSETLPRRCQEHCHRSPNLEATCERNSRSTGIYSSVLAQKTTSHHRQLRIKEEEEEEEEKEEEEEEEEVSADTRYSYEHDGGSCKNFTIAVVSGNEAGICLLPYTTYAAKTVNQLWCQKGFDRG